MFVLLGDLRGDVYNIASATAKPPQVHAGSYLKVLLFEQIQIRKLTHFSWTSCAICSEILYLLQLIRYLECAGYDVLDESKASQARSWQSLPLDMEGCFLFPSTWSPAVQQGNVNHFFLGLKQTSDLKDAWVICIQENICAEGIVTSLHFAEWRWRCCSS